IVLAQRSEFLLQTSHHRVQNDPACLEDHKSSQFLTPCMKAEILLTSLIPLAISTPLDTSTAHGLTCLIAGLTLSGLSPPERTSGKGKSVGIRPQSNAWPVPPGIPAV